MLSSCICSKLNIFVSIVDPSLTCCVVRYIHVISCFVQVGQNSKKFLRAVNERNHVCTLFPRTELSTYPGSTYLSTYLMPMCGSSSNGAAFGRSRPVAFQQPSFALALSNVLCATDTAKGAVGISLQGYICNEPVNCLGCRLW